MAVERRTSSLARFTHEARRRRVFRVAALYVVGVWVILQVADVVFPGFGIPNGAIRILLLAALAGFPVALVFGWVFDLSRDGLRRTAPLVASEAQPPRPLSRGDYATLAVFVVVAGAILYEATSGVLHVAATGDEATEAVSTPRPAAKLEHSIAVLPFANMSDDRTNGAFSDGVSEEILNRLANFREIKVIGRTSSFAFKGKDVPVPRIAELLGVSYLLQGSVRKYGDQLRISAQLLDASGVQIWSQDFDRRLVNVFAIQTEIANAVATMVVPQVAPHGDTAKPPDVNAFEHYLAGRARLYERNNPDAIRELEQAVQLDPHFAEAHAELAIARAMIDRTESGIAKGRADVAAALARKPGLPRALAAEGFLALQQRPPDLVAAERLFRQVLEQEPNMSDALLWLNAVLSQQGRDAEAFDIQQRALRVDPLHPSIVGNAALALARRGETQRAEATVERALEGAPRSSGLYLWLRPVYEGTGRLVAMNRLVKQQALNFAAPTYEGLALSYALFDDRAASDYWVRRSLREGFGQYLQCLPALWQGRYREALQQLERALASYPAGDTIFFARQMQGLLQGLAGDYAGATATLEPMTRTAQLVVSDEFDTDAAQVLAWSYQQQGERAKAAALLGTLEKAFAQLDQSGDMRLPSNEPYGDLLYLYAVDAVLLGNRPLALDRLEAAVKLGWRDYYIRIHDPRLDPLRSDPRFQSLMATVKADVDRQHREVQRLDASEDFVAELDAALATRRAANL